MTQAYDRFLAQAGLRISQFSLLRALAELGPMSMQAVSQEMGLDRTTLGRNIRPLERDGFVSIAVDERDRRGRYIKLTEKGWEKLSRAAPLWHQAQMSFERTYGEDDTRRLDETLSAVVRIRLAGRNS